jgi:hypothetical protein
LIWTPPLLLVPCGPGFLGRTLAAASSLRT